MAEGTDESRDRARDGQGREAGGRDAKGRFQPGRSGNPAGRQRGSRNRATMLRERLNPAQEDFVIRTAIDNLLRAVGDGGIGASVILLDALAPKARGRAIDLELPDDALPEDILDKAMWDMARGVITLDEALGIARYVKERQALQQQEYVSRRARARLAAREAEEAAMTAAAAAEAGVATARSAQDAAVARPTPAVAAGDEPPVAAAAPATATTRAPAPAAAARPATGPGSGPLAGGRPADALQNQARDGAARHRRRVAPPPDRAAPPPAAGPAPGLPAAA